MSQHKHHHYLLYVQLALLGLLLLPLLSGFLVVVLAWWPTILSSVAAASLAYGMSQLVRRLTWRWQESDYMVGVGLPARVYCPQTA